MSNLQPRVIVYDVPPELGDSDAITPDGPVFTWQERPDPGMATSSHFPSTVSLSPYGRLNVVVPKKRYSHARNDSLAVVPIPTFQKHELKQRKKKTPSSPATVLAMSGLFMLGLMLMLSGVILLIHHFENEFKITGGIFIGVGFLMIAVCAILQRKNFMNYLVDMKSDIYFWRPDENWAYGGLIDD